MSTRPSAVRPVQQLSMTRPPVYIGERTGEGQTNMVIEHNNFPNGARVLELQNGLLLYAEDYDILATNSHLNQL